jgi:hypothetical protein
VFHRAAVLCSPRSRRSAKPLPHSRRSSERPERVDGVVGHANLSGRFGADAPGVRGLSRSVGKIAPQWLQYGVCLALLMLLSTTGSGRFISGQF